MTKMGQRRACGRDPPGRASRALKGDPKGTISEFKLFMFTQIPLKIIGVPDLPYIV